MLKYLLTFIILITFTQPQFEECEKCECYRVQCNIIKDADIDCENKFKKSCDRKRYYLRNDFCNEICDCCIEGRCAKWNEYYCLIYKTFEFFAGIFFLLSSLNLLIIGVVHENFMKIKRKFNKAYFRIRDNRNAKSEISTNIQGKLVNKFKKGENTTDFYKYKRILYIARHPETEPHSITGTKSKKIIGLFSKFEEIRKVALQNYLCIATLCLTYCAIIAIGLYMFLSLQDKPIEYGIFAPTLFTLFLFYYILSLLSIYVFKDYKTVVCEVLDKFEEDHKCKVRIRKHKRGFEINWNPQLVKIKKKKMKGKGKGNKLIAKGNKMSFEDVAVNNEKVSLSKLKLKKVKPKIVSNKVMPLRKKGTNVTKNSNVSLTENGNDNEKIGIYKGNIGNKLKKFNEDKNKKKINLKEDSFDESD